MATVHLYYKDYSPDFYLFFLQESSLIVINLHLFHWWFIYKMIQ